MEWKAKIIDASEIDEQRKQRVVAIMIDNKGVNIPDIKREFYGDPDTIRQDISAWKVNEADKQQVETRRMNVGDLL